MKTKNVHLLVVEDDENLNEIIHKCLLSEGYKNIHVAYDGEEALEILDRFGEEIFVVTLDLKMPKVNGFDVMRTLVMRHKHIVGVIMVSGFSDLKTALEFERLGSEKIIAYDFIPLPFEWKYLLPSIKRAINTVQSKRNKIIHD